MNKYENVLKPINSEILFSLGRYRYLESFLRSFKLAVNGDQIIGKFKVTDDYDFPCGFDRWIPVLKTAKDEYTLYAISFNYIANKSETICDILNDYEIDELLCWDYIIEKCQKLNIQLSLEKLEALIIAYCLEEVDNFYLKDMFEGKDYLELSHIAKREVLSLEEVVEENF